MVFPFQRRRLELWKWILGSKREPRFRKLNGRHSDDVSSRNHVYPALQEPGQASPSPPRRSSFVSRGWEVGQNSAPRKRAGLVSQLFFQRYSPRSSPAESAVLCRREPSRSEERQLVQSTADPIGESCYLPRFESRYWRDTQR